ncbi:uncharacterized protein VDAG_09475 [Verticillium dahliae VdLs.17]|uniref:Uncharacterized protein n=1 Tax=Verticillium dahliae (strain VdLs.17 / ATCC MYA-4575 / FGSC 10137) TaxID=498257 RepID=G2XH43_VERDV|nr:uncharacterized protein VDAG_09475 [Verticillium dahliae VdLs.17]EGY19141.1 hypothetical protein VDAG_09475 [Verticillium dahliae VdLs.17]
MQRPVGPTMNFRPRTLAREPCWLASLTTARTSTHQSHDLMKDSNSSSMRMRFLRRRGKPVSTVEVWALGFMNPAASWCRLLVVPVVPSPATAAAASPVR